MKLTKPQIKAHEAALHAGDWTLKPPPVEIVLGFAEEI